MLKYFNSFQKSAFRVETLQRYNVDEEKEVFEYFQQHKELPESVGKDWHNIIQQAKLRGATMQRVHLIQFPIIPYISFEMELYKKNIRNGEEIFYIPLEDCAMKVDLDFWIFDDAVVLKMFYDEDGSFLGFEEMKDIAPYLQIKNYLLENKRNIEELF